MSRKMSDLKESFRNDVKSVLESCKTKGVEMRPFFTLRTPAEQAVLWRQSRSIEEIQAAIAKLKADGAPFLAQVLKDVGPQNGNPVTNALPGNSWHQWGEACDCFWLLDGDAEWSTRKKVRLPGGEEKNGYLVYAETAKAKGLKAGGFWTSFKDWPHIQQRAESSPRRLFSWTEIDDAMKKKFG